MWVFLNNAFFSIVEPGINGSTSPKLLVRARFSGDIEKAFPNEKVTHTPHRDYAYRALINRETVADVISRSIREIDYNNFKDSVADDWRHDAYADVWYVMYKEQWNRKESDIVE